MNLRELQENRRRLEYKIFQQRLDMAVAVRDWHEATAPIDNGWAVLMRYKKPIMLVASTVLVGGVRRPKRSFKLLRRGVLAFTVGNRIRKLLHKV
ncbi:YqjK-like family protein [Phytohalomonas tamaricis]|uniref:YqjK-like family protein n=1 Tax=Phytohalomonas tamaricis TaxID=2081032 RepID=UPI000D0AF399|nr:YqjK-like family protein [Phytohalomonas tamaricis]